MIDAVSLLNLPELKNGILDRSEARITDAITQQEQQVRFKNGAPRIVPTRGTDGSFSCDTSDAPKYLKSELEKKGLGSIEAERLKAEAMERYSSADPGDTVMIKEHGIGLKKLAGRIQPFPRVSARACERLVAKIGYEVALTIFEPKRVLALDNTLDKLSDAAFGKGCLDETILMCPLSPHAPANEMPNRPRYFHQILVWFRDYGALIDIYFFGCVGFRLFLSGGSQDARGPLSISGECYSLLSIIMTFEPKKERRKYVHLQKLGSSDIVEYDADNIL